MTSARGLLCIAAAGCCGFLACHGSARERSGAPSVAAQAPAGTAQDSVTDANNRFVAEILSHIAGRENEPSDSVFKNVKLLNTVPARVLLVIMKDGYASALGVKCTYCHVPQDFSSDEKRPKRAAREMALMHRMINQELRKMENIATPATQNRSINCSTCHRGVINPMAPSR